VVWKIAETRQQARKKNSSSSYGAGSTCSPWRIRFLLSAWFLRLPLLLRIVATSRFCWRCVVCLPLRPDYCILLLISFLDAVWKKNRSSSSLRFPPPTVLLKQKTRKERHTSLDC